MSHLVPEDGRLCALAERLGLVVVVPAPAAYVVRCCPDMAMLIAPPTLRPRPRPDARPIWLALHEVWTTPESASAADALLELVGDDAWDGRLLGLAGRIKAMVEAGAHGMDREAAKHERRAWLLRFADLVRQTEAP